MWVWFKLYLTLKRYGLNSINYQSLFGKGACAGRLDLREWQKSSLKTEMREF